MKSIKTHLNCKQAQEEFRALMSDVASIDAIDHASATREKVVFIKNIVFNNMAGTGATGINFLLARPEGCTMEEMNACRKGVQSHLVHLRKRGYIIELVAGRYFNRSVGTALTI